MTRLESGPFGVRILIGDIFFWCFRISSSSLAGHQLILGLFASLRMSTVVSGEM